MAAGVTITERTQNYKKVGAEYTKVFDIVLTGGGTSFAAADFALQTVPCALNMNYITGAIVTQGTPVATALLTTNNAATPPTISGAGFTANDSLVLKVWGEGI